jgi:hypothetical protein
MLSTGKERKNEMPWVLWLEREPAICCARPWSRTWRSSQAQPCPTRASEDRKEHLYIQVLFATSATRKMIDDSLTTYEGP